MPTGTIVLLGAFAGLTIYLGLPIARIKNVSPALKTFLSMIATGVLVFLLFDVISKASDPINAALTQLRQHHTGGVALFADILLMVVGLGLGLIGLVYFNRHVISRFTFAPKVPKQGQAAPMTSASKLALVGTSAKGLTAGKAKPTVVNVPMVSAAASTIPATTELAPQTLALIIASGIGMHNFSEGLAIGQSAAAGALSLATVLIIGFGLHNMTEGFGIAGPLTGKPTSWKFIGLLGLIGGGPTFLGTIFGIVFHSPQLFIFCLAFAAGAIIYVIAELLGHAKKAKAQEIVMLGLLVGFFLGYATDLIVTYAGA